MHFIVRQEIMYFRDNAVYGACKRTERLLCRIERTMDALVKCKLGPFSAVCFVIKERKDPFVKNQINREIHFSGLQDVFYVYGFFHDNFKLQALVSVAALK